MVYLLKCKSKMRLPLPWEFTGNATVSTYAKATAKELQEQPFSKIVEKLEEGGDRLNDDYVRSRIDWLESHEQVMYLENGFLTTRKRHTNDRRINRLFENHGAEVIIADIADDAGIKLSQSLPPAMRKMSAQWWISLLFVYEMKSL
ncbi:hypothetical protein KI387_025036 [Taxus chinensis]|uniref:Uncharacterized protein n=1 Tax=Taxus chinensis TaxID=29808 RepID=A0AA38G8N1_TAXCH|nr:hypothetical protein KI387_025036 [Taxus chinensis]